MVFFTLTEAHQMHPTQAYRHLFPYGKGEYFKGKNPKGRISCCHIRISYDYVKLHSVIQLIGLDMISNYELYVWDFEIPTMMKAYVNLRIEYIDGYAYKCKPLRWKKYYSDNYKKRLVAKAKHDEFGTLYYKLLNNSSYGKHLEKPHNEWIVNYINPFGIIDSHTNPKSAEDLKENAKYTYLGFACIPAYSRVELIEKALLFGYEKIVYFDTDSIFVIYDEDVQKVWDKEFDHTDFLGGWAVEDMPDRAQFTAPKRYKLQIGEEVVVKAGGINFDKFSRDKALEYAETNAIILDTQDTKEEFIKNYQVPYDELNITNSKYEVKRAYRVKGGTIIEFQTKEVKIPKKYEAIAKANIT